MHPVARVVAVAYLALALFAGVVYAAMVANNVNVAEVQNSLPGNVRVASVVVNWTGKRADAAWIEVNLEVANRGRVSIEIISVNFAIHENWSDDARPWYDPLKLAETEVTLIQSAAGRGHGVVIPAATTKVVVYSNLVLANSSAMDVLDHPDGSGRYHFAIPDPWFAYVFVDFGVDTTQLYLAPFYDPVGVLPSG